jgi:hypothetical protein
VPGESLPLSDSLEGVVEIGASSAASILTRFSITEIVIILQI